MIGEIQKDKELVQLVKSYTYVKDCKGNSQYLRDFKVDYWGIDIVKGGEIIDESSSIPVYDKDDYNRENKKQGTSFQNFKNLNISGPSDYCNLRIIKYRELYESRNLTVIDVMKNNGMIDKKERNVLVPGENFNFVNSLDAFSKIKDKKLIASSSLLYTYVSDCNGKNSERLFFRNFINIHKDIQSTLDQATQNTFFKAVEEQFEAAAKSGAYN